MTKFTQATYEIEIRDRFTGRPVPGCTFNEGPLVADFARRLDVITDASLILNTDECGCPCIPQERSHELVFTRDDWDEPAWIGPITRFVNDTTLGTFSVSASDRLYWWEGAPLARDHLYGEGSSNAEIDPSDLFVRFHEDTEQYEPSGLLLSESVPGQSGLVIPWQGIEGDSLWGQVASLAKTSVDYTTVGWHLYWGSPEIRVGQGPAFRSNSWKNSGLIVDRDATQVATSVVVSGANGARGVWPEVEVDLGYGKRTLFESSTAHNTDEECTQLARSIFEANDRPSDFIVTGDGTLSPQSSIDGLHPMIPGRKFMVVADKGCLKSTALQRLHAVSVEIEAGIINGERKLIEKAVKADLQPPGTEGKAQRLSA